MIKVLDALEALSSGIERQEEGITLSFYHNMMDQFETAEEKEAFHQGSLAMTADAGNLRIRRLYHTFKFRRAMKKLGE